MAGRRRAKAVFRADLPLRVKAAQLDPGKLEAAVRMLRPSNERTAERIRDDLVSIATVYRHSRKLEAAKAARPDARMCLQEIARSARKLDASMDYLERGGVDELQGMLVGLMSPCAPGVAAVHRTAHILEELSFFAGLLIKQHPASQSSSDRANEALAEIKILAELTAKRLRNLSLQTEWCLLDMQQYVGLVPEPKGLSGLGFVRQTLINLAVIAEASFRMEASKRGPRSDTIQLLAVQRLMRLYEAATGRQATHSAKNRRLYSGRAESDFGKFALASLAMFDGEPLPRRGAIDAVSFVTWHSRSRRQQESVRLQRERRESEIIGILKSLGVTNFSPPV